MLGILGIFSWIIGMIALGLAQQALGRCRSLEQEVSLLRAELREGRSKPSCPVDEESP